MTQEMAACAIGARSQMARTYLERHLEKFEDCGREELIQHGLRALKESLSQDKELTVDNTSIGIVGVGSGVGKGKVEVFRLYEGLEISGFLESASSEGQQAEAEAEAEGQSMEVDS
ncbi:20S proteasome subunit alpha 6 [Blastomyces silverae]|uniref:20S proteasome subunit alpha 6 n=1 Tax=Blastomyces silverae TaxID=2060906 RepID=A0A0H1BAI8_9EURO|nr:20S proteasome subunit alpha 6 [Blastomyces silverae]